MRSNVFGLNRSLGLAIAAIAVVAMIGGGIALSALARFQAATAARDRSARIISDLDMFRIAMVDQETGVRGYLLTGQPGSLKPYVAGGAALDAVSAELAALVRDDPAQRRRLADAARAARDWQANIGAVIVRKMADPATRGEARALEITGAGKRRFDIFRARLRLIERQEERSLGEQDLLVQRVDRLAGIAVWASAIVTLLICIGVGIGINRLVVRPLVILADTMGRLVRRDTAVAVPSLDQRNEVGAMARAVEVFRTSLIELDRTSVLRLTADTLPAMVGYIDAELRIGFLNSEFARWFDLGGDVAATQGRPLDEVFPGNGFPGRGDALPRALAGEEAGFAQRLAPRDGELRDVEAIYRPHRAPDGRVLGVVTLIGDVTDRKDIDRRMRHQAHDLQRSNEELERFAYVASHDLKAPLRGIGHLASWIEEDLAGALAGDARVNMDLLKSRVRRLESLLDDLLAYSRAGRDDAVIRIVDTRALVAELATLIDPPRGFVIAAAPDLPTLPTFQAALTQVLLNLIGNAVKHHPDPARGHVRIEAERQEEHYEFRVADDGAGIPETFRERVFGMFQTLKPRDEVEGSGMGLAIVRKLVERQTGRVWMSDRREGGLVVHFTWPAAAREL